MIRICSWCKADMGEKEPLEDKSVTHGMCAKCEFNIAEELKQADRAHREKSDKSANSH